MLKSESFLSRLRSLDREANDAPWEYRYEGPDSLLTDAHAGYLIAFLRNHTAAIIEAFELAAEIAERGVANFHSRESPTIGCEAPWGAAGPCSCGAYGLWERASRLSKVSGT